MLSCFVTESTQTNFERRLKKKNPVNTFSFLNVFGSFFPVSATMPSITVCFIGKNVEWNLSKLYSQFFLQIHFFLVTPQLHTEPSVFMWLVAIGILMCIGLYWRGYSCWSKYSLRTILCTEENCLKLFCCREENSLSLAFSCRVYPRALFCWKMLKKLVE